MKHSMYLLTMVFLVGLTTVANSQKINKPDALKTLKAVINGRWCEANYMLDLNDTKSPARSQTKLKQIVLMNINIKNIKDNRLEVEAPGVHEGGSFNIDFKKKAITANAVSTDITDYDHLKAGGYFYELGFILSSVEPGALSL